MLWLKRRKLEDSSDRPQYIKDHDLSALEDHYLFWDYLEIGTLNKVRVFKTVLKHSYVRDS